MPEIKLQPLDRSVLTFTAHTLADPASGGPE